MSDSRVRDLERRLEQERRLPTLHERAYLKRNRGSADFDLSIPHSYELIEARTYWLALAELRRRCADDDVVHPFLHGQPRLLTCGELMRARVREVETVGLRELWSNWQFTASAVLSPAGSPRVVKYVDKCMELMRSSDDTLGSVREEGVSYDAIEGIELPVEVAAFKGSFDEEVMAASRFWQQVLQPDRRSFTDENRRILRAYAKTVIGFAASSGEQRSIYPMDVRDVVRYERDHLHALAIGVIEMGACAGGGYHLDGGPARVVRVVPR